MNHTVRFSRRDTGEIVGYSADPRATGTHAQCVEYISRIAPPLGHEWEITTAAGVPTSYVCEPASMRPRIAPEFIRFSLAPAALVASVPTEWALI
jgi:hypothetical protein